MANKEEVLEWRRRKDEFFKSGYESPVPYGERAAFNGLNYFPYDEGHRVKFKFVKNPKAEAVQFQTSTGEVKAYVKAGWLEFSVKGKAGRLAAFLSGAAGEKDYFVPFRDATSGRESYPAGRYVEVPQSSKEIDFNMAYNPYCAYSPDYSCPLSPAENWLKLEIRAGEKKWH